MANRYYLGIANFAWVRSRIGIPGNTKADRTAATHSVAAQLSPPLLPHSHSSRVEGSIEESQKRGQNLPGVWQRSHIMEPPGSVSLHMAPDQQGLQKQWLHHIGKSPTSKCPTCQDHDHSGDHITFTCPAHTFTRDRLLLGRKSWQELDTPTYIQDHPGGGAYEATEEFFSYLFISLTSSTTTTSSPSP